MYTTLNTSLEGFMSRSCCLTLGIAISFAAGLNGQGIITTVAGNGGLIATADGGQATNTAIGLPVGVAVDSSGNVYFADSLGQRVHEVFAANGTIATVAGGGSPTSTGDGPATSAGLFFPPSSHVGLAVAANGNLYITDTGNNRVRKVDPSGKITTVAGTGEFGFSGDQGPATAARVSSPKGIALDSQGNLYIADTGNGRIRKVDTNGIITTVAGSGNGFNLGDGGPALNAQFYTPSDVAVDNNGNIYIADFGNNAIRKVDSQGIIHSILHGGFGYCSPTPVAASAADIGRATGIAVDKSGNLYIANESADCVQELETNGKVSTVAGGGLTLNAENVPATTAALGSVWAVAVDSAGNIFLTDSNNGRIRKVTARTTPPSAVPVVTSVVNGASFQAGIAPNCWVTVRGTNLAPKTDTWNNAIIGGQLPPILDGVSVTIGGSPAYVEYISDTQINVVTGADLATGVLPVVVTTPTGASAAFSVYSSTYSPAFFVWPGNQPVASHATDFSWAAKAGTFSGANTIAAKPGETIILWGTGMGPTSPPAPIGKQVSGGPYTTPLPTIMILATNAKVYGAALATGYAGLYQLAFQIPADFPDGDYPINGTIGGAPFLGATTLSVRK